MGNQKYQLWQLLASALVLLISLLFPFSTSAAPNITEVNPGMGIQWGSFKNYTLDELMVFELPTATSVIVEDDGTVALQNSEAQPSEETKSLQALR